MNEEKEYIGVLVKPKKYHELLEEMYGMKCIYPPRSAGKCEYAKSIQTIRSLPVEISTEIDEDIKFVTKEEYEKIRHKEITKYMKFLENYESDWEWNNQL